MAHVNIYYNRVQDIQTIILFCFPVPVPFPPNIPEPTLYHQSDHFSCSPDVYVLLLMTHYRFLTLGNPNLMNSGLQSPQVTLVNIWHHIPIPAPLPNPAQSAITSPSQEPGIIFRSTLPLTTDTSPVIFYLLNISQMLPFLSLYFSS